MGCSQFANSHFQMGFTVMGFAEQFGQNILFRQIKMFSKAKMRSESSMQKIFFDQLNLFEMSKEKKCLTWKALFCVCSFDSGYWYTKYSEMVASIMVVFAKWWLMFWKYHFHTSQNDHYTVWYFNKYEVINPMWKKRIVPCSKASLHRCLNITRAFL